MMITFLQQLLSKETSPPGQLTQLLARGQLASTWPTVQRSLLLLIVPITAPFRTRNQVSTRPHHPGPECGRAHTATPTAHSRQRASLVRISRLSFTRPLRDSDPHVPCPLRRVALQSAATVVASPGANAKAACHWAARAQARRAAGRSGSYGDLPGSVSPKQN